MHSDQSNGDQKEKRIPYNPYADAREKGEESPAGNLVTFLVGLFHFTLKLLRRIGNAGND